MEALASSNEEFSKITVELNQKITALTFKLTDCHVKCSSAKSSIEEIEARSGTVDENISAIDKELDIDCIAAPSATSTAVEYSFST